MQITNPVYLDLETTGLDPATDEILEIGILDDDGTVLLDSLVRPHAASNVAAGTDDPRHFAGGCLRRPHARRIAPAHPRAAVADREVVIYNAPFDAGFLSAELEGAAGIHCAMRPFAEAFGEWSPEYDEWHWQRLHVAAAHVGFQWPGDSHRAINDCQATRAVWHWLAQQPVPAAAPAQRNRRPQEAL